jgi:hypothetical protein
MTRDPAADPAREVTTTDWKAIAQRLLEENQRLRDELDRRHRMHQAKGRAGGKRRLETLTPERRSEIARLAARARWDRRPA